MSDSLEPGSHFSDLGLSDRSEPGPPGAPDNPFQSFSKDLGLSDLLPCDRGRSGHASVSILLQGFGSL